MLQSRWDDILKDITAKTKKSYFDLTVAEPQIYGMTEFEKEVLEWRMKNMQNDGCCTNKKEVEKAMRSNSFEVDKIIHSGPCTIVFWKDKTKTIVRLSENDLYDEYAAFCAALAKKVYGTNSHLKTMLRKKWVEK